MSRGGRKFGGKVIFLDVDGVLHSLYEAEHFNPACMAELKRIVSSTGASVVLSSTWRTSEETTNIVNEHLAQFEIGACVSKTPDYGWKGTRQGEVLSWLKEDGEGVTAWVALDDMDLTYPPGEGSAVMKKHFCNTQSEIGLTKALADRAISILMGEEIDT